MSRLSRYLWQVCAPVLLAAGSLTAQNFLYVPTESSVPPQLRVYGIQAFNGQTFNYATQNLNGNLANVVAVTPNGRFMYVGEGDGTIDAFVVNPDGTLSSVGAPFANAGSVRGLAINTAGAFLYASDNAAGAIRVFSINQTTGALTAQPGLTISVPGTGPRGMAIDGANHLYVALSFGNAVGQYTIAGNGALTPIGSGSVAAGSAPDRVAITPNGQFVYVTNFLGDSITGYTVGAGGALGSATTTSTGAGSRPLGAVVNTTGSLLIVTLNNAATNVIVYSIAGNGALSQVASAASTGSLATGVTIDPLGVYIYVSNSGSNSITKFDLASNGALTAPFVFSTGANPQFLVARTGPSTTVPTLSTWSFVLLAMLLAGTSALMYRKAYR